MSIISDFSLSQEKVAGVSVGLGPEASTLLASVEVPASVASGGEGGIPRTVNTGDTHTETVAEVSGDWLAFTVLPELGYSLNAVLGWLTPEEQLENFTVETEELWVDVGHGAMGYRSGLKRGDIKVFYDGAPGMGIHVILCSTALHQIGQEEHLFGHEEWRKWLGFFLNLGVSFTRFDVALDDFGGGAVLDMAVIEETLEQRALVTPFKGAEKFMRKRWSLHENFAPEEGETLYFGRRSSPMFIRIYDKGAQMKSGFKWTRVEMESHKEAAQELVRMVVEEGFSVAPKVLRSYLDFKVASETDSNKSRWVTASWWDAFLCRCEKARLRVSRRVESDVDKVREWVETQAATSFALVLDAIAKVCKVTGEDVRLAHRRFVYGLAEKGRIKRKPRHEDMLRAYLPSVSWSNGEGVLAL